MNVTWMCFLGSDLTLYLGTMTPQKRQQAWREKRVFFLTPQVLTNDLLRGSCPALQVQCVVVDEAHKALGNHAYCQVMWLFMLYKVLWNIWTLWKFLMLFTGTFFWLLLTSMKIQGFIFIACWSFKRPLSQLKIGWIFWKFVLGIPEMSIDNLGLFFLAKSQ